MIVEYVALFGKANVEVKSECKLIDAKILVAFPSFLTV
jgi:hypothetical protein